VRNPLTRFFLNQWWLAGHEGSISFTLQLDYQSPCNIAIPELAALPEHPLMLT
jgi:hypothetical protein